MEPFSERTINLYENLKVPAIYWKDKSLEYQYWFRSLLQKIDSALVFKNLPDGWCDDFFHACLWIFGYVAVFDTAREDLQKYGEDGIVFQPCTLGGYDFYYNPKWVQITNPMYVKRLTIGKEAELLKLTPDFFGVYDIIDHYSTRLAELSKSIMMSIINSKFAFVLSSETESGSAVLKKVFDKVQAGEPLVIYKQDTSDEVIPSKEPFAAWSQELAKNFILKDQLDCLEQVLREFYVEIGLAVSVEKQERLITAEADFAEAQSQARLACWVQTLKESFKIINEHFGTNMEVEYARTNDDSGFGKRTEFADNPDEHS